MNVKKIRIFQIISVMFIIILGSILHFTYKISGENNFVAIFSSINESTWEHLKLLFFPTLITIIAGKNYFRNSINNFICSKTVGLLIGISFIIVFFYTYTGIIGKNIAIVDISLFFIAALIGELVAYVLIVNRFQFNKNVCIYILLLLTICFIFFTFKTPKIGLFKDPLTGYYGISK